MRKYALLFLFAFLAQMSIAQPMQKTLVDEDTDISFYPVDKQIDLRFTPTSNFIQSIVFASFKVKNRYDYYSQKEREDGNKYKYFVKVEDSTSYHSQKAEGGGGFIEMSPEAKQYFVALGGKKAAEKFAAAKKEGKEAVQQIKRKRSYMDQSPYEVTTELADGTEFSIKYLNENSFKLSYQLTENGKTYSISQNMNFGETYKVKVMEDDPGADFSLKLTNKELAAQQTEPIVLVASSIKMPFVLLILLLGALFFTVYFKFPNITRIGLAINTVRGKYYSQENHMDEDNPDTIKDEFVDGEVTPFQALSAALSATVGLGNIAGVAIAISLGGPGATLWMIIAGLLGMASKFTECTLGVKYREIDAEGTIHGGPMYYLSKGLADKGLAGLGKVFAIFFAIMCVGGSFGGGNMFQANQAASQVLGTFGIEGGAGGFIFGLITAVLVAIVIIGGIKRIGKVAETIVPFMAVLYVGSALIVIAMNAGQIPTAFDLIFDEALNPPAMFGGFIGVLITGFQRAAFSNEAGVGSAAIAHSAVKTAYPASEGVVALLEPFIDTVIICTITALVIIITGQYENLDGIDGVSMTSNAFATALPWFPYVLTLAVALFAFSTMLSWSYYGLQAWKYLFGKSKAMDLTYKVLFCIFVVIGASASLGSVIGFSDAMIFAMVFPNMIGLIILAPTVRKEVKRYVADIKAGKLG